MHKQLQTAAETSSKRGWPSPLHTDWKATENRLVLGALATYSLVIVFPQLDSMNSPRLSARFRRDENGKIIWHDDPEHLFIKADSTNEFEPENHADIPIASFYFVMVGIGYLFPFSALTQPVDYWNLLFPDFNIEFPLTCIYMYTNLMMLALLVFAGEEGNPSFTPRIVGGFIGQLVVLVFVPTSYFLALSESHNLFVILAATATAAIVTAFIDSAVIALAAQYPLRVQEYFQLGVGVSTLIGSIYRDVTKVVFPQDMVVESSLLYFYSGAITIGLCILSYFALMKLPLSKICLEKAQQEAMDTVTQKPHITTVNEQSSLLPSAKKEPVQKWVIFRKVLFNEFMVLLLFMSTLSLWPPLVTEIASHQWMVDSQDWWSLILLTIFSVMDCSGRLCVRWRFGLTKDNIWIAILCRFLLFPWLISCVQGTGFWQHDSLSAIGVSLLGLTNGYIGTLSIVMVNECISEEEQAIAGTFTGFFLNSGLVLGASIGLYLDHVIVR